jgi:hypothetical protein
VLDDRRVLRREEVAAGRSSRCTSPAWSHSPYGCCGGEAVLDLVVADDAALVGVDEEHAPGLQAALLHDVAGRCRARRPRRHDHEPVVGDPVAARAEPLRSSTAPITVPSVNAIDAGPSHGSMSDAWKR